MEVHCIALTIVHTTMRETTEHHSPAILSVCSGAAKLKPATHVKVRHILCEKQSKALEALDKIKGGEQFATVRAHIIHSPAKSDPAFT